MEYVTQLNEEVPKIGVGTWQMNTQEAYESVSTALEEG
ncbi:aldehyde oxidoreductase, partial [Halobacteriales archaeon SW_10_66_29]